MTAYAVNADFRVVPHIGGIAITNNWVDDNLPCKENNPPPAGGGNVGGRR